MLHMDTIQYSQPIIKGVKYKTMLPEGTALVLEGGGTRGFYSSGVFEAFMDAGWMFPYIIGVSAGAANALSYISGQRLRSREIVEHYVGDHRYLGYRNLLRKRSFFGMDFIFGEVPQKHIFWDRELFEQTDITFLTGATDYHTGKIHWFSKGHIDDAFTVTRASCSVPFVSQPVMFEGYKLMDGGVASPIPIDKSIEDGNTFHVVVLTRNPGYRKKPAHSLTSRLYGPYGVGNGMAEALRNRHMVYNRQLELCERLEREGRAIIIRPLEPLSVGRTGRDIQKLLALYDEGEREGAAAVKLIRKRLGMG